MMQPVEAKSKEVFKRTKNITVLARGDVWIINNNKKSRFIMKDAKNLLNKLRDSGVNF